MLRVYVLEKEKTIFLFFLVIDQKLLMKVFFWKKWTNFRKIYTRRLIFFYLDGNFWTPANLQKSEGTLLTTTFNLEITSRRSFQIPAYNFRIEILLA